MKPQAPLIELFKTPRRIWREQLDKTWVSNHGERIVAVHDENKKASAGPRPHDVFDASGALLGTVNGSRTLQTLPGALCITYKDRTGRNGLTEADIKLGYPHFPTGTVVEVDRSMAATELAGYPLGTPVTQFTVDYVTHIDARDLIIVAREQYASTALRHNSTAVTFSVEHVRRIIKRGSTMVAREFDDGGGVEGGVQGRQNAVKELQERLQYLRCYTNTVKALTRLKRKRTSLIVPSLGALERLIQNIMRANGFFRYGRDISLVRVNQYVRELPSPADGLEVNYAKLRRDVTRCPHWFLHDRARSIKAAEAADQDMHNWLDHDLHDDEDFKGETTGAMK